MFTVYLAGIGEVQVRNNAVHKIGKKTYMLGRDNERTPTRLAIDILREPKMGEPGYCRITSYTQGRSVFKCNIFRAIY